MTQRDELTLLSERIEVGETLEDFNEWIASNRLGDGLPVIPPTEARVMAMLSGYTDPQREIAAIPPSWAPATLEKIAICAVMAGCLPEYLPVVVAGVEAMTDPRVNLFGLQATTGYGTPAMLVNGPIATELDINSSTGVFGPGWRANATIGHAIRLILISIGGGIAGVTDRSTFGWPGKFTLCFAENEAESPWEPLHVERGHAPSDSTVLVGGVNSILPLLVGDSSGEATLTRLAKALVHSAGAMAGHLSTWSISGGEPILVLGVDDAAVIARDGFSKADVKQYLFEHAKVSMDEVILDPPELAQSAPRPLDEIRTVAPNVSADGMVHLTDTADDLIVVVAGGPGPHSVFLPMWMGRITRPAMRPINRSGRGPRTSGTDVL